MIDMKKNIVKINENTLKQIVAESVEKVLKEERNLGAENRIIQQANKLRGEVLNLSDLAYQSGKKAWGEWLHKAYLLISKVNDDTFVDKHDYYPGWAEFANSTLTQDED